MHRPELLICCDMPSLKLQRQGYGIRHHHSTCCMPCPHFQYDTAQHMLYMTPQKLLSTLLNIDAITNICNRATQYFKSTQHHRFFCSMKSAALSLLCHDSKRRWYSVPWGGEGPVLGALRSHSQERQCGQNLQFPLPQVAHLPRSTRLRPCPAGHNVQFKGSTCSSATYMCAHESVLRHLQLLHISTRIGEAAEMVQAVPQRGIEADLHAHTAAASALQAIPQSAGTAQGSAHPLCADTRTAGRSHCR